VARRYSRMLRGHPPGNRSARSGNCQEATHLVSGPHLPPREKAGCGADRTQARGNDQHATTASSDDPEVTARPRRLVLLGHPVGHSLSPTFHNAALRHLGIPVAYEAIDVAPSRLRAMIDRLVAEGAAGNVTIPHKEAVAAICADLTPLAARVGAVNTFWVDSRGRLLGDNTDVGGFEAGVRGLLGEIPREPIVAVLGAGGSAAAVLAAVERWPGARAILHARTEARAEALRGRFAATTRVAAVLSEAVESAHIVVNATPIGLSDDAVPVSPQRLPREAAVIDLVYRRGETEWVRRARQHGLRAVDGLPMLIEQGALAFERWFGLPAPRDVMRASVR
jgi:shikimate dehydrogenase